MDPKGARTTQVGSDSEIRRRSGLRLPAVWGRRWSADYRRSLQTRSNNGIVQFKTFFFLDFKLSPCSLSSMFPFGYFPGVWVLKSDVSEPSIGSIFMGRWMKNEWGWDVRYIMNWRLDFKFFAVFVMQYVFFWVIPRRLSSNSRRFGTLYRFHLHGKVNEEWLGMRRAVYNELTSWF